MADGIYIGMAGATARAAQLESISDNLANVQTPGFKKQEPAFQAFLNEAHAADQAYPAAVRTYVDTTEGTPQRTEEKLDIIPNDNTFIAVQNTANTNAFTRNGHLTVAGDGTLMAARLPVLDVGGHPIRVPPNRPPPEIRGDGTVWSGEDRLGKLATFKLEGPMERMGANLVRPIGEGVATPFDTGVRVGELEMSNSSPLQAAVQLVAVQRHFENAMQTIQTYRKMDERSVELGRVR